MRSWNEHVWTVQLGTDLPEHAPPSLQHLCIQVSGLYNICVTLYSVILQIHAGDPNTRLFARQPNIDQWKAWFAKWNHLKTVAFICEDVWWRRSSDITVPQACEAAEKTIRQWLVDSSLQRFELWSGVDDIELSPQFQVAYAKFHKFDKLESTRNRYSFERDETGVWTLLPLTLLPVTGSAIRGFCEGICTQSCWICQAFEGVEAVDDMECIILCWDDIKEEDWNDRIMALKPWSRQEIEHTYSLSI
jgi:hypothetical protein